MTKWGQNVIILNPDACFYKQRKWILWLQLCHLLFFGDTSDILSFRSNKFTKKRISLSIRRCTWYTLTQECLEFFSYRRALRLYLSAEECGTVLLSINFGIFQVSNIFLWLYVYNMVRVAATENSGLSSSEETTVKNDDANNNLATPSPKDRENIP